MNSDHPSGRVSNHRAALQSGHSPQGALSMVDSNVCDTSAPGALSHPAIWLSLALVLTVLEGAVRKWVPGFESGLGRSLAYFSKDLCFLIGTLLVLSRPARTIHALGKVKEFAVPALVMLLVGAVLSSVEGFNAVGAVLSLRAVAVLPVLGYLYCSRVGQFPLLGFAVAAVVLSLINAPLALIQNGLPNDHFLNKYTIDEMYVADVAAGVRATGTCAYISGLAVVSALGLWGGMVIFSLAKNWKGGLVGSLGILSGLSCAFSSVSRATVVTSLTMLGLWAFTSTRTSVGLFKILLFASVPATLFTLFFPSLGARFLTSAEGSFDRFEDAGDNNWNRAFGQWEEMWDALTNIPLGTGLGTEQVGGNAAATGVASLTTYESQFPRIVGEFGVLGLLGFFALAAAVVLGLHNLKRDGNPSWALVVTATQVYVLGQVYGSLVYNHTASAAVWLVVAAVFAAAPAATVGGKAKSMP
jgi:hypothetical protein